MEGSFGIKEEQFCDVGLVAAGETFSYGLGHLGDGDFSGLWARRFDSEERRPLLGRRSPDESKLKWAGLGPCQFGNIRAPADRAIPAKQLVDTPQQLLHIPS